MAWGGAADAFLATQGDAWDTQWDMFLALCGAIIAPVCCSRAGIGASWGRPESWCARPTTEDRALAAAH
ncbi:MAG: DUF2238 domain-containing protein [bacterium]